MNIICEHCLCDEIMLQHDYEVKQFLHDDFKQLNNKKILNIIKQTNVGQLLLTKYKNYPILQSCFCKAE